jgi:hypothetical protein
VDDIIPPSALRGAGADTAAANAPVYADDLSRPEVVADQLREAGSGIYHSVVGGYKGIWAALSGNIDKAAQAVKDEQAKAYQAPQYKPTPNDAAMSLPAPTALGDIASEHGASPGVSTLLAAAPTALTAALAPRSMGAAPEAAPVAGATASATQAAFDSAPIEGGLPDAAQQARAAVLQRVGLDKARTSAITGNAKDAATDFQLTKFDEPAGVEAKAQFDTERAVLQQHAEGIVKDTGGTLGTDEDTLNARGQTIAAPFDQLRQWFDSQKQKLYGAADTRAGGVPIGDMTSTESLLKDPDFTETLLAKNQGSLLDSVNRQYSRFKALNPGGMTVENAENFRKWINKVWTPDNSATLGKIKGAVDDDVMRGAGEDIYGPARQLAQTEYQTLDNPNGISRIMDTDPKSPLNRTTPYVKIPDTITRLDPDQFSNVLKTLDSMPDEIQPAAQAAKAEIKAHLANKLVDAGSSTQGQWNAPAVSKVLKQNSAKLQTAFDDQPEVLSKIQDLQSAGNILRVNQGYPGAAAQAANALKRGMMSRVLSKASAATGALGGSAAGSLVGAPGLGAAVGAGVGETLGSSIGQGMSERAALARWNKNMVSLSDLLKAPGTK